MTIYMKTIKKSNVIRSKFLSDVFNPGFIKISNESSVPKNHLFYWDSGVVVPIDIYGVHGEKRLRIPMLCLMKLFVKSYFLPHQSQQATRCLCF